MMKPRTDGVTDFSLSHHPSRYLSRGNLLYDSGLNAAVTV